MGPPPSQQQQEQQQPNLQRAHQQGACSSASSSSPLTLTLDRHKPVRKAVPAFCDEMSSSTAAITTDRDAAVLSKNNKNNNNNMSTATPDRNITTAGGSSGISTNNKIAPPSKFLSANPSSQPSGSSSGATTTKNKSISHRRVALAAAPGNRETHSSEEDSVAEMMDLSDDNISILDAERQQKKRRRIMNVKDNDSNNNNKLSLSSKSNNSFKNNVNESPSSKVKRSSFSPSSSSSSANNNNNKLPSALRNATAMSSSNKAAASSPSALTAANLQLLPSPRHSHAAVPRTQPAENATTASVATSAFESPQNRVKQQQNHQLASSGSNRTIASSSSSPPPHHQEQQQPQPRPRIKRGTISDEAQQHNYHHNINKGGRLLSSSGGGRGGGGGSPTATVMAAPSSVMAAAEQQQHHNNYHHHHHHHHHHSYNHGHSTDSTYDDLMGGGGGGMNTGSSNNSVVPRSHSPAPSASDGDPATMTHLPCSLPKFRDAQTCMWTASHAANCPSEDRSASLVNILLQPLPPNFDSETQLPPLPETPDYPTLIRLNLWSVIDGHGGGCVATYASEVLLPHIAATVSRALGCAIVDRGVCVVNGQLRDANALDLDGLIQVQQDTGPDGFNSNPNSIHYRSPYERSDSEEDDVVVDPETATNTADNATRCRNRSSSNIINNSHNNSDDEEDDDVMVDSETPTDVVGNGTRTNINSEEDEDAKVDSHMAANSAADSNNSEPEPDEKMVMEPRTCPDGSVMADNAAPGTRTKERTATARGTSPSSLTPSPLLLANYPSVKGPAGGTLCKTTHSATTTKIASSQTSDNTGQGEAAADSAVEAEPTTPAAVRLSKPPSAPLSTASSSTGVASVAAIVDGGKTKVSGDGTPNDDNGVGGKWSPTSRGGGGGRGGRRGGGAEVASSVLGTTAGDAPDSSVKTSVKTAASLAKKPLVGTHSPREVAAITRAITESFLAVDEAWINSIDPVATHQTSCQSNGRWNSGACALVVFTIQRMDWTSVSEPDREKESRGLDKSRRNTSQNRDAARRRMLDYAARTKSASSMSTVSSTSSLTTEEAVHASGLESEITETEGEDEYGIHNMDYRRDLGGMGHRHHYHDDHHKESLISPPGGCSCHCYRAHDAILYTAHVGDCRAVMLGSAPPRTIKVRGGANKAANSAAGGDTDITTDDEESSHHSSDETECLSSSDHDADSSEEDDYNTAEHEEAPMSHTCITKQTDVTVVSASVPSNSSVATTSATTVGATTATASSSSASAAYRLIPRRVARQRGILGSPRKAMKDDYSGPFRPLPPLDVLHNNFESLDTIGDVVPSRTPGQQQPGQRVRLPAQDDANSTSSTNSSHCNDESSTDCNDQPPLVHLPPVTRPIDLTTDHSAYNPAEVTAVLRRCNNAPRAISAGVGGGIKRVAGSLAVTRALGDAYLKTPLLSFNPYKSHAPYITARPEVNCRPLMKDLDKVLILGTDGVWERASGEDVLRWVRNFYEERVAEAERRNNRRQNSNSNIAVPDMEEDGHCSPTNSTGNKHSSSNSHEGADRDLFETTALVRSQDGTGNVNGGVAINNIDTSITATSRKRGGASPTTINNKRRKRTVRMSYNVADVIVRRVLNKVRRARNISSLQALMSLPLGRARRSKHDDITSSVVDLSSFVS